MKQEHTTVFQTYPQHIAFPDIHFRRNIATQDLILTHQQTHQFVFSHRIALQHLRCEGRLLRIGHDPLRPDRQDYRQAVSKGLNRSKRHRCLATGK